MKKYTDTDWVIDGSHIISVNNDTQEINGTNETICDFNPETEYPTVHERNANESLENAKLICKAPKMHNAIEEVLELFDGNGVPNIEWIKNKLSESIS